MAKSIADLFATTCVLPVALRAWLIKSTTKSVNSSRWVSVRLLISVITSAWSALFDLYVLLATAVAASVAKACLSALDLVVKYCLSASA